MKNLSSSTSSLSPSSRAGQLSPLQDDTYSDPTQYVAGLNIMIGTLASSPAKYKQPPFQAQNTVTVTTWETVPCRRQWGWWARHPGAFHQHPPYHHHHHHYHYHHHHHHHHYHDDVWLQPVPRGGNEHEAVVGRAGERLHRGKVGHHHRHHRHHRYHHHHHHQSSNHHREILHRSKVGLLIRN